MKTKELENALREEKTAVLIVNTYSRRGENLFFRAMDGLDARGIKLAAAYPVRNPKRLPEFVKEAIGRGHKLIIVGGGDGTISSVVDYFVERDIALGVLPLGTGNSFARSLGIPVDINGALDVIAKGKLATIDVGEVVAIPDEIILKRNTHFSSENAQTQEGILKKSLSPSECAFAAEKGELPLELYHWEGLRGHHFANIATIGFSADVARLAPRWLKRMLGVGAYALAGLWQFFTHGYFDCDLTINGQKVSIKTHQVIIANGSHYGTSKILPDFHIDNKQLLILTMDSMDRWQIVKFWLAMLTNGRVKFPDIKYIQTPEVYIETRPRKRIDIDGELTHKTPALMKIHPDILNVMVPHGFNDI